MSNEVIWIVTLLVSFGMMLLAFKLFGKVGLFAWTVLVVFVANVQVLKTIELFGIVTTAGNIIYATSFLATDILNEIYSRREAMRAVWFGLSALIATTLLMQLTLQFIPHSSDWANPALLSIFGIFPRVALGSGLAYIISQTHDVWAYNYWRKKFPSTRAIWIRNNASTMISQLIDTVIFCMIAFWGVFPLSVFTSILITTYVLKWLVAACDTPFVYIARWMYDKDWVPAERTDFE